MSGFNIPSQNLNDIFAAASKGAVVDGDDIAVDSRIAEKKREKTGTISKSKDLGDDSASVGVESKNHSTKTADNKNSANDKADKDNNKANDDNASDLKVKTPLAQPVQIKKPEMPVSIPKPPVVPTPLKKELIENIEVENSPDSDEKDNDNIGDSGDTLSASEKNVDNNSDIDNNSHIDNTDFIEQEKSALASVKKETPIGKEFVDRIIAVYNKISKTEKDSAEFVSALLLKDKYTNANNFVYNAVNLSKQDVADAKLLYQLISTDDRVERVFTLLDIPMDKLERLSDIMEILNDTEILGDNQKVLSKNIESEIAVLVENKGIMFFANNKQLFTDMIIAMI